MTPNPRSRADGSPPPADTPVSPRVAPVSRWWVRALAWVAAAAVLALAFSAYLQPGMVVELGNRLWSCF